MTEMTFHRILQKIKLFNFLLNDFIYQINKTLIKIIWIDEDILLNLTPPVVVVIDR